MDKLDPRPSPVTSSESPLSHLTYSPDAKRLQAEFLAAQKAKGPWPFKTRAKTRRK